MARQETLRADILVHANDPSQQFRHSRSLDIISTYIRDFYRQKAKEPIRQKDAIGYIQNGYEGTDLIRQADLMDLKNAPDYTFLFGVSYGLFQESQCQEQCWFSLYFVNCMSSEKSQIKFQPAL